MSNLKNDSPLIDPLPQKFNFFATVHKSILSADFYRNVRYFSPVTALKFVLQMCLLTALISGAAYTYYAFDDQRGLPAIVPEVFPGMSLKNGLLDPGRSTPFAPEKAYSVKMLNMLFCMPGVFDVLPDSFIVVDTSLGALEKHSIAQLIVSDRFFALKTKQSTSMKIAYSKLFPGPDTIAFTRTGMDKLLRKNRLNMFINFFIQTGIITAGALCVSIIFLTFAAFIFRIEKREKVGCYFKKACFAVSPIFIGNNLIAASGSHIPNTWYLLLMIAVFVMFRGIRATHTAGEQRS